MNNPNLLYNKMHLLPDQPEIELPVAYKDFSISQIFDHLHSQGLDGHISININIDIWPGPVIAPYYNADI